MFYWFDFGGRVVPAAFLITSHPSNMYDTPTTDNSFDKYDEPRLHMEALLSTRLIEFDISIRILFLLESAGIKTLGDLTQQTRQSLRKISQIGTKSIDSLEKFLLYHGFSLPDK